MLPRNQVQGKLLSGTNSEKGASMVQFALAFPVFMVFVVVIIDLGRITALSNVIREGLAIGLQQALSVPNLDVDPRGLASTDDDFVRLQIAKDLTSAAGLRLIGGLQMIATGDDATHAASTGPKLFDIVFSETRISDGPIDKTYKIAVLLPGECVTVPAIGLTECNRDTLGIGAADPMPQQPPEELIRKHPVKIIAFAQFDAFTPWLFNGWQRFEQYGYRQPIPRGPFAVGIDPQPADEIQAEMEAEDQEPLGAAPLPTEEPKPCTVDWGKCIKKSANDGLGLSYCPDNVEDPCSVSPVVAQTGGLVK
jgi:hypothetical protein